MKIIFENIFVLILVLSLSVSAGEIRFSGVLGQSQPIGQKPLNAIEMKGIAFDTEGGLWSFASQGWTGWLIRFVQTDSGWCIDRQIKSPLTLGVSNLCLVNEQLIFAGIDGRIRWFDMTTNKFAELKPLPVKTISAYIQKAGHQYVCLALAENTVYGLTSWQSKDWNILFKLTPLEKGRYYSLITDPQNHGVLVGSSYPDMFIRCYDWDGREIKTNTWPRMQTHSSHLARVKEQIWALDYMAVGIPDASHNEIQLTEDWMCMTNSVAQAHDGSWWFATSQGLIGYDTQFKPLNIRVGGLVEPKCLVVSPDNLLLVYDTHCLYRMMIDDLPQTPLDSRRDADYRIGGNYKSQAVGIQFHPDGYVVLDQVERRLWQWDIDQEVLRQKKWVALTDADTFTNPQALAMGIGRLFVCDAGEILSSSYPGDSQFHPMNLKADGLIAVNKDNILCLIHEGRLAAYAVDKTGNTTKKWQTEVRTLKVTAMTLGQNYIVLVEKMSGKVTAFSIKDGSMYATMQASGVTEGMRPLSVALSEPWVFVGDEVGRRILRFRIK